MGQNNSRYTQMESYMTRVLLINAALFVLYLIFAGCGVIWMKAITAIFTLIISAGCIAYLYLCRELTRRRSQWMSISAAALFVLTLASLILNYPSPV